MALVTDIVTPRTSPEVQSLSVPRSLPLVRVVVSTTAARTFDIPQSGRLLPRTMGVLKVVARMVCPRLIVAKSTQTSQKFLGSHLGSNRSQQLSVLMASITSITPPTSTIDGTAPLLASTEIVEIRTLSLPVNIKSSAVESNTGRAIVPRIQKLR